ncbi:uncharacterized protein [Littorina saxatilis]|uniref:Uncharacterized protein n=1 Tax=Littorina saxatilis TaxID=31220 RepID=A0AAN9FZJ5_9CAEN
MEGALYNLALSLTRTDSPINNFSKYLGGDSMHIQVLRKCTFADFVKHLTKLKDNTPGVVNTNNRYVIDHRLKALKMSFTKDSKEQTWYMNCDGDCVKFTSNTCYIRWHPNVVRVFATPDP